MLYRHAKAFTRGREDSYVWTVMNATRRSFGFSLGFWRRI